MKLILSFLIVLWIFASCTSVDLRSKPNFVSIEITKNYESGAQTIFIDSLGIITKCKYQITNRINSSICCIDTLSSEQIDTLNSLIRNIKNTKIDSTYGDDRCQDGIAYLIRINLPGRLIQSEIRTCSTFDNDIFRFAQRISDLKIEKNLIDSMFVFQTTKKVLITIPPKE